MEMKKMYYTSMKGYNGYSVKKDNNKYTGSVSW